MIPRQQETRTGRCPCPSRQFEIQAMLVDGAAVLVCRSTSSQLVLGDTS
jgi:hypothetical protein